ncbi:toprim domain-containing protein [Sphaerotilus sp.]|uniref:DUF7146 domain-containing protein n=1 Tax=Sphaerotilus sp. TaxID=2093942 RepID=UPI00286E9F5F|nr:toprim domain-containing protein [Sphaerotilus sp.]
MSRHLIDAISAALGQAPEREIIPGEFLRFGGRNKPLWVKLFADGRTAVFGSWIDGTSATWTEGGKALSHADRAAAAEMVRTQRLRRETEQRETWAKNSADIAVQWSRAHALQPGDPVTLYLKRRLGAVLWPLPAALRYVPSLPYWHDGAEIGRFPAMVAAITNPAGELVSIHRTWLTRDGRKADVPGPVKKLTRTCGPLAGAGIALWNSPDERGVIGVAEGLETALAAHHGGRMPVCAAYSAGALAAWQWPAATRHLVIWADHDEAGTDSAKKLRSRAHAAGLTVTTKTPSEPGTDWADVVFARNTAATVGAEEEGGSK